MVDKKKQMKTVINEIKNGKSRKEAAKSAGITEYRIVNWYTEGKNGFGKENIEFYLKLKEIENNTEVNEEELINKMNQFLTLFEQGNKRQDIIEQIYISDLEIGRWLSFGRSSVEPYNYFYNEYNKIRNLNKSRKKSVDIEVSNKNIILDEDLIKNTYEYFNTNGSENLITVSVNNFKKLLNSHVGDIISVKNKNPIYLEIIDIDYFDSPYEDNNQFNSEYDLNIYKNYSGFVVRKLINGKNHIFGYYDNIKYAYFVRNFLIENDWDLTKFKCIELDEENFEYYIIKILKNRVYILDEFYTYNEAYLNYMDSLKEFVIKIFLNKYGFERNYYVDYLNDIAEDLFLEVDKKMDNDTWLIDRLPEIIEPKIIEKSEENNIDLTLINSLTLWQKMIFDEVNKFDNEIFTFDELKKSLSRFKSKNFDNKIRKYLGELINLELIVDLDNDNYKRNW